MNINRVFQFIAFNASFGTKQNMKAQINHAAVADRQIIHSVSRNTNESKFNFSDFQKLVPELSEINNFAFFYRG